MLQNELNLQQRRAVTAPFGAVAIIAGPGTGKTKTLIARIQHLIAQGEKPGSILALTFTKKSAEELRQRLGRADVWAGTFHALSHEVLGGDQTFVTDQQRNAVIKELKKTAVVKNFTIRELGTAISWAKNTNDVSLAELVSAYNQRLAELGVIDFDDLLLQARDRLKASANKRAAWHTRFTHILVDEFQDTNSVQYDLLHLLDTHSLFVIGDPLQSIYGFRGAAGDVFSRFKSDHPAAREVVFTINYRSTQHIVGLANALFNGSLTAHRKAKGQAQTVQVLNEFSEANWVLDHIQKAIGGSDLQRAVSDDDRTNHRSLRDFAILYRNRSVARMVQRSLEESGLPYQVVGDGSPYDNPKVQVIIACLQHLAGDSSQPIVGFSDPQIKAILKAIISKTPFEAASDLMTILKYEPTKALRHLLATLARFKTLPQATDYFKAIGEQQFYDPSAEAVTLLTIHASKGLEFPVVFLLACEDGVLPSEKGDNAEEKRLLYVAATRAQDEFYALHAAMRRGKPAKLSQFVRKLSEQAITRTQDPQLTNDQRLVQKRRTKKAQTSLF